MSSNPHYIEKYGKLSIDDMVVSSEPYLTEDELTALPPSTQLWVRANWPVRDCGGGHANPYYARNTARLCDDGGRVKPRYLADDPSIGEAYQAIRQEKERLVRG